jgi:hypothetical protein
VANGRLVSKLTNELIKINWQEKILMSRYKYEVIIYWSDEDDAFIAEVPELSGCAADGVTYAEALNS